MHWNGAGGKVHIIVQVFGVCDFRDVGQPLTVRSGTTFTYKEASKDVLLIVSLLQVTSDAFQPDNSVSVKIKLVFDEQPCCIQHSTHFKTAWQIINVPFFIACSKKCFPNEIFKDPWTSLCFGCFARNLVLTHSGLFPSCDKNLFLKISVCT